MKPEEPPLMRIGTRLLTAIQPARATLEFAWFLRLARSLIFGECQKREARIVLHQRLGWISTFKPYTAVASPCELESHQLWPQSQFNVIQPAGAS